MPVRYGAGEAHALVVARAPVPGRAKTRLGRVVGMERAADLAAAALLDTIDACASAFPGRCHLALAGDLTEASRGPEISRALDDWAVFAQDGASFGDRLAHAHRTVGVPTGVAVVQIGMDTPQVSAEMLRDVAGRLDDERPAVLGPAFDGGWWCLALRDRHAAAVLADVPMSLPTTASETRAALVSEGLQVVAAPPLVDVDTAADADAVAGSAPHTRFARTWRAVDRAAPVGRR